MSKDRPTLARTDAAVPCRAGVGLKPEHYRDIVEGRPSVGWLEVHPENYMGAGGPPHYWLEQIRSHYPISLHGVGLSIGAARGLSKEHLDRLSALIERYEPGLFSEHLAWSTHNTSFMNDLLPLPYTRGTLALVAEHVDQVQAHIGRRMLIENPSTYVAFTNNEMTEIDFLTELAMRTGCGLLLDINNVFISGANHGFDPAGYIDAFPVDRIEEIHLAGHDRIDGGEETELFIDSHNREVSESVWGLYRRLIARTGPLPTLIEWDNNIPSWSRLAAEAQFADNFMHESRTSHAHH
jgi:uncharacterized protein (UPF0276 family)